MDGISFEAGTSDNLNQLTNSEYTKLFEKLRSELYTYSGMKSRQRIAALELIESKNKTSNIYDLKFLLLPAPVNDENEPMDETSEMVIQTYNSTINKDAVF